MRRVTRVMRAIYPTLLEKDVKSAKFVSLRRQVPLFLCDYGYYVEFLLQGEVQLLNGTSTYLSMLKNFAEISINNLYLLPEYETALFKRRGKDFFACLFEPETLRDHRLKRYLRCL